MIRHAQLKGEAFFWPSGPVGILLVHGFTATTAEVRPLACKLHQHGYTVAAPLLPGHGTRPDDLNQVRWQDWASAAQNEYQRLTAFCEQVFVGGESSGALLSLYMASQHPKIAGILAYAPALKLTYTWLQRIQLRLAAPFIASVRKSNWTPHPLWQGYGVLPLKGGLEFFKLQRETLGRLPNIRQPILIVLGRLDKTVHPGVSILVAGSTGSSATEIHWMEETGHLVILDQEREQVAEITLAFIDRCLAGYAGQ
jgi:carboxylesterase